MEGERSAGPGGVTEGARSAGPGGVTEGARSAGVAVGSLIRAPVTSNAGTAGDESTSTTAVLGSRTVPANNRTFVCSSTIWK